MARNDALVTPQLVWARERTREEARRVNFRKWIISFLIVLKKVSALALS